MPGGDSRSGEQLEEIERIICNFETRGAGSCDFTDDGSPYLLTPGSAPSRPQSSNFWKEVSPQISFIDGSNASSVGIVNYGRSTSCNLDNVDGLPTNHLPSLPALSPLSRHASDSLCSPRAPSSPTSHNAVVQVEKGNIKTKIHKRLSFGDTLDLRTNVYTPADEIVALDRAIEGASGSSLSSADHRYESEWNPHLIRRKSLDAQSHHSFYMEKDLRYYFQHPWCRLIIAYFVIFCNFLLFAEDPVSHSHTESYIPVVGNVFSFVATKYPDDWIWRAVKVTVWLLAILCGMLVGKVLIHGLFFKMLRLKMFRDDQGSWMVMFLTVIVSLYMFSYVYNLILLIGHPEHARWQITPAMYCMNESMMKAAATCTWLGDLITALMVTDMMLQDNLYPQWASGFRRVYRLSNVPRILIFWVGSILVATTVIFLIVSDYISWDKLNKGFVETTELSRAFLASFILVMDLIIVMQDWDFPHFTHTVDVNLPGFPTHTLHWRYFKISMTGKWFNYGIIFLVMMLDLNMWKNQIFYSPEAYGQYIDPISRKVYTVEDEDYLAGTNSSFWTWDARGSIDPSTGVEYRANDMFMYSRYMGYDMSVKCTAFIPNILGFVMLITLIVLYGRFPPNQDGTYGGRLKKKRLSWRRERRSTKERFCTESSHPCKGSKVRYHKEDATTDL